MEISNLRKQLLIAGIIYIGNILAGYASGWTAPVIPKLQDPAESPLTDIITDTTASWIASVIYIGTLTGPLITSYLSNIVGRKPCLLLGSVITAISFVLVILTRNPTMIFVLRILKGFGMGIIFIGNIVYIGEIASTNIRGTLLTGTGVANTLGFIVVYAVGPYVSYASTGWIGLVMTLLFAGAVVFIPESPVFHVIKGNEKEAKRILINLGRVAEIDDVLATKIEKEKKKIASEWKELVADRSNRKALTILFVLNMLQQMSGVIPMTFFTTTIFDMAGSSIAPHIATIIIGVTRLGSCCLAVFLVERSGRKRLLLISTSVCCASLVVLGGYFYFYEIGHSVVEKVGWLPLVTLIIFFTFYEFGFGIIPPTLTGEMFRSNVRSTGAAVTATGGWLVSFGLSSAFGYMLAVGGHFVFWVFAAPCACATVFTAFYVPETKGKTLLEIQEILAK